MLDARRNSYGSTPFQVPNGDAIRPVHDEPHRHVRTRPCSTESASSKTTILPLAALAPAAFASSARSTRSGVIGSSVTQTPTASYTAAAIAGGCELFAISPMPFAPYGPSADGFSMMIVSIFGRSSIPGAR